MRLTVVGCSGSIPSPRSPASCYLLEAEGFRLVLDLGSGALGPLQRYAAVHQVDAVALSHLHADHFIDMCSFWVARKWSPDARCRGSRSTARLRPRGGCPWPTTTPT
jgi:ribonuclease BN (tRNA processing enzyme)